MSDATGLSSTSQHFPSPAAEFWAGVRGVLPLLVSDPVFGVLYGALAVAVLPPGVAMGMSAIVFAGSAQMISVQLFASATPGAGHHTGHAGH